MKSKLYYGWYIALAGLLMQLYNNLIFGYGWTAFLNPIRATFSWNMTQLSLASSMRSLETGVFNPVWGIMVDRWSPRKLMPFGIILTALGIFCLSQTRNLAMYYVGFLIVGIGSSLAMMMIPQTIVARWFRNNFGKANGLLYMGAGIAGVSIPLVAATIDSISWQTTLFFAAIGLLVIGLPVSTIFRSRPEDYGLLPDGLKAGDTVVKAAKSSSVQSSYYGVSARQALKTRAFWHIAAVIIFQQVALSTVMLYTMPYLTDLGMERAAASRVIMLYTLASLFTRVPMGLLSDIIRKSYVVALSVGLQTTGLIIFWLLGGTSPFWLILIFAIIYGFGVSGVMPLRAPLLQEYFGTRNFGTIFGVIGIFTTITSVASQPLAGWIFDTYHQYKSWWIVVIAFGIVALISILTIPKAKRIETTAENIITAS